MLTIIIHTTNTAFDPHTSHELARILDDYAARVRNDGDLERDLFDINGNQVGTARWATDSFADYDEPRHAGVLRRIDDLEGRLTTLERRPA